MVKVVYSITPKWPSLIVPIANCKRERVNTTTTGEKVRGRTISVASTRVPTIFNRTFVFFSMICVKNSYIYFRHHTRSTNESFVMVYLFIWGEWRWVWSRVELHLLIDELEGTAISFLCCDAIHKFLDRGVPVETQTPITVQRPQRSPSTQHSNISPNVPFGEKIQFDAPC